MVSHAIEPLPKRRLAKIGSVLLHEFRQVLPPTIFFFVGFNIILLSKRLMLADYLIQSSGFVIATTSALLAGKIVLVADKLPFLRRFDRAALVQPILFKTIVYTLLVFVARLIEALVHYLVDGGSIGDGAFVNDLLGRFSWHHFIAVQMWIFVLFLIYVTASELNHLIGDGELFKIFFKRPSSTLKSTRRARIRLLVQLSRLMDAHSLDELNDVRSPPHAALMSILRRMATPAHPG